MNTANARASLMQPALRWGLPVMLLLGLVIRLLFIGDQGFTTDVSTFDAWVFSLLAHGFGTFYAKTSFADYPPGYFYVLALVGHIWNAFFRVHDGNNAILSDLVKMPAILADLVVGWLIFAIGSRFASRAIALGAAALYIFNPVTILISAVWGQIDSVAAAFALLAVYFLLKSEDSTPPRISWWIVAAWPIFAYSLLIKPQAAVLIPIFVAFAFVDRSRLKVRVASTALGIVLAFVLAYALALPFHSGNPINVFEWLLNQYAFGSSVYPYNAVNAFNLWAIKGQMWLLDSQLILGIPQFVWGLALVIAALVLILWRYLQERSPRAFLESCALALLAFFMLATRMHERYLFDGLLFTIVCLPLARRYLWGAILLSITLFANLKYSLAYLAVMNAHTPGVDAHNLWGVATSMYSLVAVATFFVLGYLFLGSPSPVAQTDEDAASSPAAFPALPWERWRKPFDCFDPRAGMSTMRAPLDYIVMSALGVGSFVLSFVRYWYPPDKVFDEVYFARAAEEYLRNVRIYENTHPPLSKLLVTLSVMLFGGMPHGQGLGGWVGLNAILGHFTNGDNSYGWRFLDVLFGALVVMLLYVFAKRITGSTLFAAMTALFLTLDGMHFVQSRIATPEGFVIFFSVFSVYAFYRFWIASQTNERNHINVPVLAYIAAGVASLVGGGIVAGVWKLFWSTLDRATTVVTILYIALGLYLFIRYVVFPRMFGDGKRERTFGDGSYSLTDANGTVFYLPDGRMYDPKAKVGKLGDATYDWGQAKTTYNRDGSVTYASPHGDATYTNNEIHADGHIERGRTAKRWLLTFTVMLGLLVSTKWYGVMGFGVSFAVLIGIWLQRAFASGRASLWGNARGFRLDGALVTIVFVSMTVYALVWTPDLVRHAPNEIANANDVVYRQYSMFEYHDTLKATHPYSSKWWEWPIDEVPVAYFYQDHRVNKSDPTACCVQEITSMPNPFILWFGLLCVPIVGFLGWRERNKGYALIVVAYLMQWLPWMLSPRIAFAYHFYVDIPLICVCNTIVLQRVWQYARSRNTRGWLYGGAGGIAAYVLLVAFGFVFFYPILAAVPIPWDAWHHRMWFEKWVIGPG